MFTKKRNEIGMEDLCIINGDIAIKPYYYLRIEEINMKQKEYTDNEIEDLWKELEDVTMVEDKDGKLRLQNKWKFFKKGTWQNDIWNWFDSHYSKGVGYLTEEAQ